MRVYREFKCFTTDCYRCAAYTIACSKRASLSPINVARVANHQGRRAHLPWYVLLCPHRLTNTCKGAETRAARASHKESLKGGIKPTEAHHGA